MCRLRFINKNFICRMAYSTTTNTLIASYHLKSHIYTQLTNLKCFQPFLLHLVKHNIFKLHIKVRLTTQLKYIFLKNFIIFFFVFIIPGKSNCCASTELRSGCRCSSSSESDEGVRN